MRLIRLIQWLLCTTVIAFATSENNFGTNVSKFLPNNPYTTYVYYSNQKKYIIIQNNGIENSCLNQFTIGLSSESPSTYLLSKKDVEEFLNNKNSKKFIKKSSVICYKNGKIYTNLTELYGKNKIRKSKTGFVLQCKTEKKTTFVFNEKRDTVHSLCTDENNHSYEWHFAEGIGLYKSTGIELKTIHTKNNKGQ